VDQLLNTCQEGLPKVISFDMDGTLVDGEFPRWVWNCLIPSLYSKATGISLEESKVYVYSEYEKVGPNKLEFFDIDYWFKYFNLSKGFLSEKPVSVYSDVLPTLKKLTDFTLVVSSSSSKEIVNIELDATNMSKYFSHVFSAPSDFREVTKSLSFYQKVCDVLKVNPRSVIHIGDEILSDCLVPGFLGIRSFYLNRLGSKHMSEALNLDCIFSLEELPSRIYG